MMEHGLAFTGANVRLIDAGLKTQTRRVVKWGRPAPGLNLSFSGLEVDRSVRADGPVWTLVSRRGDGAFEDRSAATRCPHGQVGDRLWVRETWRVTSRHNTTKPSALPVRRMTVFYAAGGSSANQANGAWGHDPDYPRAGDVLAHAILNGAKHRPGMFMPRWASRLDLELRAVRVERLLTISEADAIAEGVYALPPPPAGHDWSGPNRFGARTDTHTTTHAPTAAQTYFQLWDYINGPGSAKLNPWVWVLDFTKVPP